jgi:hypothetical protein
MGGVGSEKGRGWGLWYGVFGVVGLWDVLRVALARASWSTDIVTTNIFMSKISS